MNLFLGPISPAPDDRVLHGKMVKHSRHHKIHQLRDALGMMVKPGTGRHDHHAKAGQFEHIIQVYGRKRGFTDQKYQLAPLLQHHIGGSFHEIVARPAGDGGECPGGTGAITMAAGALDPLATGAVHCSLPKTLSKPLGA